MHDDDDDVIDGVKVTKWCCLRAVDFYDATPTHVLSAIGALMAASVLFQTGFPLESIPD